MANVKWSIGTAIKTGPAIGTRVGVRSEHGQGRRSGHR